MHIITNAESVHAMKQLEPQIYNLLKKLLKNIYKTKTFRRW